jgi:protein JSN1
VVSGLSTPLREIIPESPGDENDPFPDLGVPTPAHEKPLAAGSIAATRRARAGTAPSRPPPGLAPPGGVSIQQTPQVAPGPRAESTGSPFRPGSASIVETASSTGTSPASAAAILSRIRAGSMPQRASLLSSQTPFGPAVFSTSYNRGRASTLSGLLPDSPSSPPGIGIRKDSLDADIRTLDYLGLVDPSPISGSASNAGSDLLDSTRRPMMASQRVPSSRFRSYSVNAKEQYAREEEEDVGQGAYYSGMLTPSAEAAQQALAFTQEQIRRHNLDVQAFAHAQAANRPRAQTTGLLDSQTSRIWKAYDQPEQIRLDETEEDSGGIAVDDIQLQLQQLALQQMAAQAQATAALDRGLMHEDATRSLWLGNVPPSTTISSLKQIFENFGKIESARVLTHKSCGFVNFDTVESALDAKSMLDGTEIFPGAGPIRINFAKVQTAIGTPAGDGYFGTASPAPHGRNAISGQNGGLEIAEPLYGLNDNMVVPPVPSIHERRDELLSLVRTFGATEDEITRIALSVDKALVNDNYSNEVPPVPENTHGRIHDAPKLRDIRKRIDNNACTPQELEEIAIAMLPEVSELASDYLGNTVVQKLFDYCSEPVKEMMLAEIRPHLAEIGVHKNGTWAAQKIIDVAHTPAQMGMIVDGLRPYGVAAFLDQYGNYVMQCCLKFGLPYNNFIFDVMLTRLWDVAQGRFGARAMRACLESHHATKDQQRTLAAAIALNSVQLATNANAALLLTWYLDTCTFPGRRAVLVPLMLPRLTELCTHKIAYLTILKLINQRNEPQARDTIIDAIFTSPEDTVLTEILKDQACGATLIFKILTTPFFEESQRTEASAKIRTILLDLKVPASQGYKRLLDEVGLSTRPATAGGPAPFAARDSLGGISTAAGSSEGASRPSSKAGPPEMPQLQQNNGYFPSMPAAAPLHHQGFNPAASNGFVPGAPAGSFDPYTAGRPPPPQMAAYQRGPMPPQYGMPYAPTSQLDAYRLMMAQQAVAQQRYGQGYGQPQQQMGYGMPGLAGLAGQGYDPAVLHRWAESNGYLQMGQQGGDGARGRRY